MFMCAFAQNSHLVSIFSVSDWKSTMYAKFLKIHDKPIAINNMHEWRFLGTENRFDHPALFVKKT